MVGRWIECKSQPVYGVSILPCFDKKNQYFRPFMVGISGTVVIWLKCANSLSKGCGLKLLSTLRGEDSGNPPRENPLPFKAKRILLSQTLISTGKSNAAMAVFTEKDIWK